MWIMLPPYLSITDLLNEICEGLFGKNSLEINKLAFHISYLRLLDVFHKLELLLF